MRISSDEGDNTDYGYIDYLFCVFQEFLIKYLLNIQKCRDREVNRII